jgi:hypothetical protein
VEKKWKGKLAGLTLVNAEVDRELASYVHRENAMQNRATVLIGAASVVGAIQLSEGFAPLNIINLVLSFVAAVLGVRVLFPRKGDAPDPRPMHEAVLDGTPSDEALHRMIEVKIETLYEDEDSLSDRGKFARIGFIVLTLSILAAAIGAFVPAAEPAQSAETEITVTTVE